MHLLKYYLALDFKSMCDYSVFQIMCDGFCFVFFKRQFQGKLVQSMCCFHSIHTQCPWVGAM